MKKKASNVKRTPAVAVQRVVRRRNCVTHHHACDCREEWFEKVEKANSTLRAAMYDIIELESGPHTTSVVAAIAENALTNSALDSPPNDKLTHGATP